MRQLEGVPADAVVPEARLSTDLGIDSLGRVELLSLVEEELGVYIDDGELDPDETVGGLQARVDASAAAGAAAPQEGIFALADEPAGAGRSASASSSCILKPIVAILYRRRVTRARAPRAA